MFKTFLKHQKESFKALAELRHYKIKLERKTHAPKQEKTVKTQPKTAAKTTKKTPKK